MQTAVLSDTGPQIRRLIREIEDKRLEIQDELVEGWLIRRASPFEIADHLGTMVAESRPGCTAPLILPDSHEIGIAVIEGEIVPDGYTGSVSAGHFWVVRRGDGRRVVAVQHPTKICCTFFLGGGHDGPALADRQAA